MAEVVGVEVDVGVEDSLEEEEEEVAETEIQEMEVVKIREKDKVKVKVRVKVRALPPITGTKPLVMLTSLLSRPVSGTGPSGSQLIFVWSQGHAHGRTSGSQKPTNRKLTSSTTKRILR